MLGVLLLGFGGAGMTGACGSPLDSCPTPPDIPADTSTECAAAMPEPCMRYRIPLLGDPNMNLALRQSYIDAFGSACYVSDADNPTFNCFYKKWEDACAEAVKIGKVSGNAPYKEGYKCQPVGNGNYTLQTDSDVANYITIYYEAAPRQTPLIDVKSVPTEVSGPYRNLTEPQNLAPGQRFNCNTVDKYGAKIEQRDLILQVNRDAHGGEIHSDLAGFEYPCGVDENCKPKTCTEPLVLKAGPKNDPEAAQVHHVVPMTDGRSCPWGTNSNKNAAVISRALNIFLYNKEPTIDEVVRINKVPPYTP